MFKLFLEKTLTHFSCAADDARFEVQSDGLWMKIAVTLLKMLLDWRWAGMIRLGGSESFEAIRESVEEVVTCVMVGCAMCAGREDA